MGRSFANKLWNAARLVLLASEGLEARRHDAHQADRWITSRFGACLEGVEAAVDVFDFTAAVDTVYHFVWDEFCDWYLELAKVRLYGEDEGLRREAGEHARWVLDQIVRLLHPFLPFVTEEIAAQYGAAPLLEQRHPRREDLARSPEDEAALADVQAAVNALRAFRAETNAPPSQVLDAVFVGEDEAAAERYAPFAAAIRALGRTEVAFAGPAYRARRSCSCRAAGSRWRRRWTGPRSWCGCGRSSRGPRPRSPAHRQAGQRGLRGQGARSPSSRRSERSWPATRPTERPRETGGRG